MLFAQRAAMHDDEAQQHFGKKMVRLGSVEDSTESLRSAILLIFGTTE